MHTATAEVTKMAGRKRQDGPRELKRGLPEVSAAAKAIRALQKPASKGGVALEAGPTPERLARAAGAYEVGEHHDRVVERITGGKIDQVTVKSTHIRINDAPFDRLIARQQLCPPPSESRPGEIEAARYRNAKLGEAGDRYRKLWYQAGLGPISAQDLTREGGRGSAPWAPYRSESQASARMEYRAAREALHTDHRSVLDQVLLAEVDLVTAGRNATGRRDDTAAAAIAVDRIICACATLVVFFKI